MREVDTPVGTARAHVEGSGPVGLLVLGHGAGGGIEAEDLRAARDGALDAGWTVARVEQPWRVQGKRVAVAPPRLDVAWTAVVMLLRERHSGGGLVLGGRSAGARVACRTASSLGAVGVLAFAFPLHPPGKPDRSRAAELAMVAQAGIRLRIVQGRRDPFGGPREFAVGLDVAPVDADHAMRGTAAAVRAAVRDWLIPPSA